MAEPPIMPVGMSPDISSRVLRTEDIISQLRMALMGVELVKENGVKKYVKFGEPLMNEKGIFAVTGMVGSFLNRNTTLSYLKEHREANKILKSLINDITMDLFLKQTAYDLDISNLHTVTDMILNEIQFAAYRPVGTGDRGFLKGATSESIIKTSPLEEKKGGLLGLWGK